MKHHEYQIYYGGFKIKLLKTKYCEACDLVRSNGCFPELHYKNYTEIQLEGFVRSHKKRTAGPRSIVSGSKQQRPGQSHVISKKN